MADILPELTVLGIHIIVGGGGGGEWRVEIVAHEQAGVALGVVSMGIGMGPVGCTVLCQPNHVSHCRGPEAQQNVPVEK